jgi:hypothetical protein
MGVESGIYGVDFVDLKNVQSILKGSVWYCATTRYRKETF